MTTLPLGSLLALLATGCCGDPPKPSRQEYSTGAIPQEEFDAALDEDGNLTVEGCDQLCRAYASAYSVDEVLSCAEYVPGSSTTGTASDPVTTPTTPTETGDSGFLTYYPTGPAVDCVVIGTPICVGGRDHCGLDSPHAGSGPTPLGAWLAAQAHAERTSVHAFHALAGEMERLGAPAELIARCRDAARDEVVHARLLGTLAARRGAVPGPARFSAAPVDRSLVAFAVENAVEGCVRETWAAVVAFWQAEHAADPELRGAFRRIAADEARHAELAHAIDAWVSEALTADERAEVRVARDAAIDALLAGDEDVDDVLTLDGGLPTQAQARALVAQVDRGLWRAAA